MLFLSSAIPHLSDFFALPHSMNLPGNDILEDDSTISALSSSGLLRLLIEFAKLPIHEGRNEPGGPPRGLV